MVHRWCDEIIQYLTLVKTTSTQLRCMTNCLTLHIGTPNYNSESPSLKSSARSKREVNAHAKIYMWRNFQQIPTSQFNQKSMKPPKKLVWANFASYVDFSMPVHLARSDLTCCFNEGDSEFVLCAYLKGDSTQVEISRTHLFQLYMEQSWNPLTW